MKLTGHPSLSVVSSVVIDSRDLEGLVHLPEYFQLLRVTLFLINIFHITMS